MHPSCALLGGFPIGARDALLWQHYGNARQSPAVIRQAQRTPHAPAIKSMRLLRVSLSATRPFHFIHTAPVLQHECKMRVHACTHSVPSYSACNARIASTVLATAIPSVRLSVRHTPVLCQNDGT